MTIRKPHGDHSGRCLPPCKRPSCLAHRPSTLGCLAIDHVLLATRDLAEAARELEARHGLRSIAGGRHPGWGTENRIVPLGDAYLELVAVANLEEARDSAFGQWVARAGSPSPPSSRLGSAAGRPRRRGPAAGARRDVRRASSLPRASVWRGGRPASTGQRPSRRSPSSSNGTRGRASPGSADSDVQARLVTLVLEGDPSRLASWLGRHALPLEVGLGAPAVVAVIVRTPAGETVVEAVG